MKYQYVDKNRDKYPVETLCRVLNISSSGYYKWISKGCKTDSELTRAIKEAFQEVEKRYGCRRLWKHLLNKGVNIGKNKVAEIMRTNKLKACSKRKNNYSRSYDHSLAPAENLLKDIQVTNTNEVWTSDITEFYTKEGKIYLTGVLDLCNKEIAGWNVERNARKEMVLSAYEMAICQKSPGEGLVVHSDRGSQYRSNDYKDFVDNHKFKMSMSGKGKCYDNAAMESFWATLKTELVPEKPWANLEEARHALYEYIELFYNRQRLHSSLGYMSPVDYSKQFKGQ